MDKIKLFKEEVEKKPSEVTQEEWDAGKYYLNPKNDGTPMAWDADFKIDGDNIVITGSVIGGDNATPDRAGQCKIVVSKRLADEIYDLYDIEY